MKKTLSVNLGGTVFQIDEDAYNLLDNYLNNLRAHFRHEAEGEEIVYDMEMRISELFTEGMEGGQQVITIDNVEEVITRMGRPDQFNDDDGSAHAFGDETSAKESDADAEKDNTNGSAAGNTAAGNSNKGERTAQSEVKKRLFRDVDHRILGGVLSGIAAYFGWDPTALRLVYIFLGLLPSGPSMLIIYLILLFIIPPARTATEKLQMRGEPVNMENIGKTVTGGFEREEKAKSPVRRTGLQNFLDAIVSVVGLLIKILLVILIICCLPILFVGFVVLCSLFMSLFGVFVHIPSICMDLMPNIPWNYLISSYSVTGIFFFLSLLLVIGLPIMVIIQVILQHFGYCKSMSPWAKLSMVLLWFVALIVGLILFFTLSTL